MRTNRWPMREIVARRYYRPKGFPKFTGCVDLTLECGHSELRKRSRDPQRSARCWACHIDGLDGIRKIDPTGEDDVLSTTEA